MNSIFSFILLLCISHSIATIDMDSVVLELDATNYDEVVASHDAIALFFYAPWCGACKKAAPAFLEAGQVLKDQNVPIVLAMLDAWDEANVAVRESNQVNGFPKIVTFRKGEEPHEFTDDRSLEVFVRYFSIKARPYNTKLTTVEDITEFSTNTLGHVAIVGFFDNESDPAYESFMQVAKSSRDMYKFGVVINADQVVKETFQVSTTPSAVIFKTFDEKQVFVSDLTNLETNIAIHRFPLIDFITKENNQDYITSGTPLAFFFVDTPENILKFKPILTEIAKDFKPQIAFVFVDWGKYGSQARKLGLSGEAVPCLAIENTTSKNHYAFDESIELTSESIRSFVTRFVNHELSPTIASQPIPTGDEVVKTVVALNFQDVVMDSSKDVVLEFYAPWCGHCKKLAPVWEQLAEHFKDQPNVVFAKLDATANDISQEYELSAYPTLMIFRADDKKPIIYSEKDRSFEGLLKWVEDNTGLTKVTATEQNNVDVNNNDDDDDAKKQNDDDDDNGNSKSKKDEL